MLFTGVVLSKLQPCSSTTPGPVPRLGEIVAWKSSLGLKNKLCVSRDIQLVNTLCIVYGGTNLMRLAVHSKEGE